MKILIVGNGGREHAIAWKLSHSSQVQQIFCTPGNGGTATLQKCQNIPIPVEDFSALKQLIADQNISLVVVGPEVPLALGITDYLQQPNLKIFGPIKAGAILEASKSWAKDFMAEANIPTAKSATFTSAETAKAYIKEVPIVVKADGLAAGKGVTVATTIEMAHHAIDAIFQGEFEPDTQSVIIEEFLTGQEVSVLALTDGLTIRPLLPAQDHKQVGEGDTGLNTGGMGAYAPTPIITPELMTRIQQEVLEPTLTNLQKRGIDYRGIVYAGLMISPTGEPKVLEFNCRFGDPETQSILSLLETPLEELFLACCEQRLAELPPINWKPGVAVCVVLASGGYPEAYEKGKVISGIEKAEATGVTVFHAGTKLQEQQLVTDGGRVLGVTAIGSDFSEARTKVYNAVDSIEFDQMYYRRDIGDRIFGSVH
ncbi:MULTISPECIES: phosphoribosylamine--glycine ligase [Okeania]|uniref:Phosphoribosylamine--glycine ligase n=1 Tax=Okeania hirsuta TaxID=1458930 RepID=A0A3N6PBP6_9CYAN|nr:MULTISPECIES: phosphoribosylamine--glycine ligase [Okeania]NET16043.1 phosphoribosylamine--glycine ligase [Okeania sp. SIO1H6]NES75486.1 phosphoribosylamine--glycine ligase [Okeania sp. SIO1H4]NES89938.1 phosphoribosylamine--glycine ligase [Okeania sp. SIO2B9]NET17909.1 phosphoribosylamine--glycine ligase [Okeania sp. SIO1H5]NET77357.1 phosphoribosylamine--glycine ligase [Okeania sp. SIO1F9]